MVLGPQYVSAGVLAHQSCRDVSWRSCLLWFALVAVQLLSGHASSKDRDLLAQRFAAELQVGGCQC
jgi:hypothetical protein